jgi:hypothetical protein
MSVLEGYSDHDCSILLGCARRDVLAARNRALQRIGDAAGLHRRLQLTTGKEKKARLQLADMAAEVVLPESSVLTLSWQ